MEVFRAGGKQLRFTRRGSGPPLVLLHGLSGSARWWRLNIPAFAPHYSVYTPEYEGLGVQEAAELITLWLDAQNLREVALIGHSMGGHIAMNVAARSPRISRLVLASATGLLRGQWWRMAAHLPQAALKGDPRFVPTILGDSLRVGLPRLRLAARDLLSDDVSVTLPHIWQPTLVIWGDRDVLVPLALGKRSAQALRAPFITLPAGHVVMVDAPAAFNRAVLDFLEDA